MRRSITAMKSRRRQRVSVELLEDRQLLATITVGTTADPTGTNSTLSLRQAIEISNGTLAVSSLSPQQQAQVNGVVGNTNTIDFNIPKNDTGYNAATGVWTIAPGSNLPTITKNAAIIDGYSQPGASKNTLAIGDNAKLAIALDGAGTFAFNGLTIAQPGSGVSGLDIENFSDDGIQITAAGGVQVTGCFIGTDPAGDTAAGNSNGVELDNSSNQIGGVNVADRNVISGNGGVGGEPDRGVYVPEQKFNPMNLTPTGNVIENNYVGLDASGTKALANNYGVIDDGAGDTYGGTATGVGNVISGNTYGGLFSNSSITVEGNFIGTDATGNVALGNGLTGDGMFDNQVTAGPITVVAANNVVSGNDFGIRLDMAPGSQSSYEIKNNLIGTNAAGTAGLGNSGEGVELDGVDNLLMQNNVISANLEGVRFLTADTLIENVVVQANKIGTDISGTHDLGNQIDGIDIYSGSGLTIGGTGTGDGNTIDFNGQYGIELLDGQQDRFTQNTIVGNKSAGIYVGWGYNNSAHPPVLAFTPASGGSGTLSGNLTWAPNTSYTIEVFSNAAAAAGDEQGATFVQDVTLKTDASGKGSFSLSEPSGVYYTATATDPSGDTSAFSDAVGGSQALPASTTAVSSSANPSMVGQEVIFTAVVSAPGYLGTPIGTVTFTIDGQAEPPVQLALVGSQDEAQFITSTLTPGQHTVTTTYTGDTKVSGSSGSLYTQIVNKPNQPQTTTTLGSSLNPSTKGQQLTFTAVVSAPGYQGTPTGTVTFTIDGKAQPAVALAVVDGVDEAQFVTSTLSDGAHTVTAAYSGGASFATSSSSPLTQDVTQPGLKSTTTAITSSLNPSTLGQTVTFTAVVSPGASAGTPTGTVSFTIDGTTQKPAALRNVGGVEEAVVSIATLSAGAHSVGATYNGDATFAPSVASSRLVETVNSGNQGGAPGEEAPTVMSLERLGIHMQPTVLVLTFNDGLDPTSASDLANYKIVGPAGRKVAISSATFDAALNTVTIRPKTRINLHHTYELTVIGTGAHGVKDTQGFLLDGANNSHPGSNYTASLTWRNVVWAPGELNKYGRPKPYRPA